MSVIQKSFCDNIGCNNWPECYYQKGCTPPCSMIFREMLWLSHGCKGLYSDDGEMQCASYG